MRRNNQEQNIILALTHEYRYPSSTAAIRTAEAAAEDTRSHTLSARADPSVPLRVNMSNRFVGLVVVPGQYITKIELEGALPPPYPSAAVESTQVSEPVLSS